MLPCMLLDYGDMHAVERQEIFDHTGIFRFINYLLHILYDKYAMRQAYALFINKPPADRQGSGSLGMDYFSPYFQLF